MTKPDYTALDAAILEAVARAGQHTQLSLVADTDAKRMHQCSEQQAARLVERRLQALRRAWKIEYHPRNGWQRREQ